MNPTCEHLVPDLVDAAEGRRPSPELSRHLQGCDACRAELGALEADLVRLAPEPAPEPGPWLAARIRRAADRGRHRFGLALLTLAPAATMILTVLLVLHLAPGPFHHRAPPRKVVAAPVAVAAPEPTPVMGPGTILPEASRLGPRSVSTLEASSLDPDGITPSDLDAILGGGPWGLDVHDLVAGAPPKALDTVLDDFPG